MQNALLEGHSVPPRTMVRGRRIDDGVRQRGVGARQRDLADPLTRKWRGARHARRGEYQDRRAMSYAREPAGRLRQNALGARVSRSVLEPFLEPSANSASNTVCIVPYLHS